MDNLKMSIISKSLLQEAINEMKLNKVDFYKLNWIQQENIKYGIKLEMAELEEEELQELYEGVLNK